MLSWTKTASYKSSDSPRFSNTTAVRRQVISPFLDRSGATFTLGKTIAHLNFGLGQNRTLNCKRGIFLPSHEQRSDLVIRERGLRELLALYSSCRSLHQAGQTFRVLINPLLQIEM